MKKLSTKLSLFILLLIFLFLSIFIFDYFVMGNQYSRSYNASLIDKYARLSSISEPKIILVGNSNVSFGINSAMIEDALGMPVVNLGLHGNLGNKFHENIIKGNVSAGDIVVICHTSYSDNGEIQDPQLAWLTIGKNPELWVIIEPDDYLDMMIAYPSYFRKSFELWSRGKGNEETTDCYSRSAFNEYGDVVRRPPVEFQSAWFVGNQVPPDINDTCVNRLNELNDYITACGATLYIAGYPIAYGDNTSPKEVFAAFEDDLRSRLNCEVISHFSDYFFPHEMFYNGNYHLTEEGAAIRTNLLICDLQNALRY